MQNNDWLEVGFIFEEMPGRDRYEALLDTLPDRPGPNYGETEYKIDAWAGPDLSGDHYIGDTSDALAAITRAEKFSITTSLGEFELLFGTDGDEGLLGAHPHLTFSATVYPFKQGKKNVSTDTLIQRRETLVSALATAAEVLDPLWGFGRRGGIAVGTEQDVGQLARSKKPPLYDYNVFSQETVEQLGRERVTSAPAWVVEELPTGGVFIAVRPPPNTCGPGSEECVAVAEHLDVAMATPERYQ